MSQIESLDTSCVCVGTQMRNPYLPGKVNAGISQAAIDGIGQGGLVEENQLTICTYIDNEKKNGNNPSIPAFCPVPKVKGIYVPSQDKVYETCIKLRGNVNKKLPGTLGTNNALSRKMKNSILLRSQGSRKGTTRFVLNNPENRLAQGLSGGVTLPLRNRF